MQVEHDLPRIVDASDEQLPPAETHLIAVQPVEKSPASNGHQAAKRNEQLILHNSPQHDNADKAPSSLQTDRKTDEKICKPDGYIRGVDAFKDNQPTALFKGELIVHQASTDLYPTKIDG